MLTDRVSWGAEYARRERTRRELPQAFGDFMAGMADWSWFVNPITFRGDAPCPDKAISQIGEWLADLQALAGGADVGWVIAEEFGKIGGRWHAHGLVSGVDSLDRRFWWAEAFRRFGRTRIEPFDRERAGAYYAAKYAAKQMGRIHLGGMLVGVAVSRMVHERNHRVWDEQWLSSEPCETKSVVMQSAAVEKRFYKLTPRRNGK